jgi:hypothetical protein
MLGFYFCACLPPEADCAGADTCAQVDMTWRLLAWVDMTCRLAAQVDMTWYGHVHSYSRTCPVYQRNCMGYARDGSAAAPVHVLIGHAGAPYSWAINDATPPYYDAVAIRHGYLRATANRTAFHAQARRQLWLLCVVNVATGLDTVMLGSRCLCGALYVQRKLKR